MSRPLALLSVTRKDGIASFASELVQLGFEILASGGTAVHLREQNIPVTEVSDWTASPEVFEGRVKTLHPKVHGGILMDPADPSHQTDAAKIATRKISVVAVNLYDFAAKSASLKGDKPELTDLFSAINAVDIGGPAMLRGAAKNFSSTYVVIDPSDYPQVIESLKRHGGQPSSRTASPSDGADDLLFRAKLATKVFAATAAYDQLISRFFAERCQEDIGPDLSVDLVANLRYGENPHQKARLYALATPSSSSATSLARAKPLQGKELSFNNYLDLDAALGLARDLHATAPRLAHCVIVKHGTPCGVATAPSLEAAFSAALHADRTSAFGGIVALSHPLDGATANAMHQIFFECIVAPKITDAARDVLQDKKNLRLVAVSMASPSGNWSPDVSLRSIDGGLLVQDADRSNPWAKIPSWRHVAGPPPRSEDLMTLGFAMTCVKHVRSNGIVLAHRTAPDCYATVGIGGGQTNRIDALRHAASRAGENGKGAVLASDAFFPFRDCLDLAAAYGVVACVQPGGSIRDDESIAAANEKGIALFFTGERHFRH